MRAIRPYQLSGGSEPFWNYNGPAWEFGMKPPVQDAFPRDASSLSDTVATRDNSTRDGGNEMRALRREARAKLREFFWLQSADPRLAERCAIMVYGPICTYENALRRIKVHRRRSHYVYERVPAGKSAVAGLRRLQRHMRSGGYLWTKAWAEAPPIVHELIFAAAKRPISIPILGAPDPDTVAPFIARALKLASDPRARTVERDQAVIAILRAYQTLYDSRPTNPAPKQPLKIRNEAHNIDAAPSRPPKIPRRRRRLSTVEFIRQIEIAFEKLLPEGFGVSRSKATLHRLIKQASHKAP
jgi:hypothetical protein